LKQRNKYNDKPELSGASVLFMSSYIPNARRRLPAGIRKWHNYGPGQQIMLVSNGPIIEVWGGVVMIYPFSPDLICLIVKI
jgi:hypothetical protein